MNRPLRRLRARYRRLRFEAPGYLAYWLLRPRAVGVRTGAIRETWDVVADGAHNSNTDLIYWNGQFWLCHQTSPYHMGSRRRRLLLWRSSDARTWEKVTEFKNEQGEYRDPKFAAIHDRLFVYMLPNVMLMAEPVTTVYTSSADGASWEPPAEVDHPGWLFWRPKTIDCATWYVTAYWHEHGKSTLLKLLTDLPSAGDTSYAGVVLRGDELYASYYTSPPERDFTWIMGMLRPSNIRMARVDLPALERLALS